MIRNEIKALKLLKHPNIVKLYEIYEVEDQLCLVMEHVQGETLFGEITRNKGLNEKDTAILMKQLFSALSYLQYSDLLHCDIKPENIIIQRDAGSQLKVKLIDFGFAFLRHKQECVKKGGTAGYIAPEILNNEFYDFKADLYSAGVVMYTW